MDTLLQIVMGALGSLGFGILLRMRPRHLLWATLGGGLSWCVYLLLQGWSPAGATVAASLAANLWAMLMARWRKAPAVIFMITAVVPLIPGSGLYYTMSAVVARDYALAGELAAQTLLTAGSIGFGTLLFSAAEYGAKLLLKRD